MEEHRKSAERTLRNGYNRAPAPGMYRGNVAGEITQLLQQWRAGDLQVESALELLLPDLRKIAGCCFRGERSGHSPTHCPC
jgi:hypothetical protein